MHSVPSPLARSQTQTQSRRSPLLDRRPSSFFPSFPHHTVPQKRVLASTVRVPVCPSPGWSRTGLLPSTLRQSPQPGCGCSFPSGTHVDENGTWQWQRQRTTNEREHGRRVGGRRRLPVWACCMLLLMVALVALLRPGRCLDAMTVTPTSLRHTALSRNALSPRPACLCLVCLLPWQNTESRSELD